MRPGLQEYLLVSKAVSQGRNHAPLEVLLQQGAEPGWVSKPDCLEISSTAILKEVVRSQSKKLSA
eukprot:scaffold212947_cov21-Tisochrysis_lutea.AAC.1